MEELLRTDLHKIFILHDHADMDFVHLELLPSLKPINYQIILSSQLPLGQLSIMAAERAIAASRATLLVLSPDFLTAREPRLIELLALHHSTESDQSLIPLTIIPCNPPLRLRSRNSLDLTIPHHRPAQLKRLQEFLTTEIGGMPAGELAKASHCSSRREFLWWLRWSKRAARR